jgi:hypothetical protein
VDLTEVRVHGSISLETVRVARSRHEEDGSDVPSNDQWCQQLKFSETADNEEAIMKARFSPGFHSSRIGHARSHDLCVGFRSRTQLPSVFAPPTGIAEKIVGIVIIRVPACHRAPRCAC